MTARNRLPLDRQRRLVLAYSVVTLVPLALLLLHIVLSFALAGGQVAPNSRRLWGEVLRYPVVAIPAWLPIGLAVVAAGLLVPLVISTSVRRSGTLQGPLRYSMGGIVADGGFAFLFPAPDGTPGLHWIGAVISAVCAVVLLVRILRTDAEYTRLMRAGELHEDDP